MNKMTTILLFACVFIICSSCIKEPEFDQIKYVNTLDANIQGEKIVLVGEYCVEVNGKKNRWACVFMVGYDSLLKDSRCVISSFSDDFYNNKPTDNIKQFIFEIEPDVSESTYYYQACLVYSGVIAAGEIKSIHFDSGKPTVTTSAVSEISFTAATCGGNITKSGSSAVSAMGVCWGTSHNPTINGNHTTDGSGGSGIFTSRITGLYAGTTYYVRAYATNSAGISYGNEVSFTTSIPAGWVNMGLPSGLLWAECNLGATTPDGYGNYYAWGETTTKSDYSWSTYRYGSGIRRLTKYCDNSSYGLNGFTDNLTTLQSGDDAATAVLGNGARMPTKAEWQELLDNTTTTWTTQNGVYGRKFTAANGNSLFLPAAGCYCEDSQPSSVGRYGFYWSSSLYESRPCSALYLYFDSGQTSVYENPRCNGFAVRAVLSLIDE